jgi:hypothetical protein
MAKTDRARAVQLIEAPRPSTRNIDAEPVPSRSSDVDL